MMETNILLTGMCYFVIFLMVLFVMLWLIWENGKMNAKNAADYNKFYNRVKYVIDHVEVCEQNYNYIMRLLKRLGKMKHKNKEKTSILTVTFFRKYTDIAKKRVSEN